MGLQRLSGVHQGRSWPRENVCEAIVQSARKGDCVIITSAITLAEVVRPRQKGAIQMTEAEDQQIMGFFANPFMVVVDFSEALGKLSRQLQWKHNLGVMDAVHIASAIAAKVDFIESYDPGFLRVDPTQWPGCAEIREPYAKQPFLPMPRGSSGR